MREVGGPAQEGARGRHHDDARSDEHGVELLAGIELADARRAARRLAPPTRVVRGPAGKAVEVFAQLPADVGGDAEQYGEGECVAHVGVQLDNAAAVADPTGARRASKCVARGE